MRNELGLMPYDYERTRYNNPLKVLEYLANGLPVVCCPNISVADYPYVYFFASPEEFVEKIQLATKIEINRDLLYRFLQYRTWDANLEVLEEYLKPFMKA